MSRAFATVALLTMLALGGCLGAPSAPTESPTQTETETPMTACPYVLTVDEAGEADGNRTAYADLSAARQQEFDRALDRGEYELGDRLPDTWSEPRIVEYEGEEYYTVAYVC